MSQESVPKKAALWMILLLVVTLASVAIILPTTAAAKPVKSEVVALAFGLIFPDGRYEYDFVAAVEARGEKRCLGGRKVSFSRDEESGPDTLIGAARTDSFGAAIFRWKEPDLTVIAGDYFAKVKQAVKKKGPGTRKCLADRSPTFSLTAPDYAPRASFSPQVH